MDVASGDANLLLTLAAENDFPAVDVGGALSDQITTTALAAGIEVTVEVTRFGECFFENIFSLI